MARFPEATITESGAVEEIDRLLNDPEVPMSADRVWELVEALAARGEAVTPA